LGYSASHALTMTALPSKTVLLATASERPVSSVSEAAVCVWKSHPKRELVDYAEYRQRSAPTIGLWSHSKTDRQYLLNESLHSRLHVRRSVLGLFLPERTSPVQLLLVRLFDLQLAIQDESRPAQTLAACLAVPVLKRQFGDEHRHACYRRSANCHYSMVADTRVRLGHLATLHQGQAVNGPCHKARVCDANWTRHASGSAGHGG
ncbi:hypothetical protein PQQ85_47125, partial [Paraburkholderia sediminicola]